MGNTAIEELLPDINKAIQETRFRQIKLLSKKDMASYSGDCGFTLPQIRIEDFEKQGLLYPVYFDEAESTKQYFHPFQIWLVDRIFHVLQFRISPTEWITASMDWLSKQLKEHKYYSNQQVSDFRASNEITAFYRLLILLVQLDPLYIPSIRSRISLDLGTSHEDWFTWYAGVDREKVLQSSGLAIDEVKSWHKKLSSRATHTNPLRSWYLLVRHANYDKRQQFKGSALLAQDYYEMAEMLRRFVFDLRGEELPAEDAVTSGEGYWKQRWYGTSKITYDSRLILRRIVREYGLDPAFKLHWLVEGDTEVGFINTMASKGFGINLEKEGIALLNVGGSGALSQRYRYMAKRDKLLDEWLAKIRSDEAFVFLTADNDQNVHSRVQELRKAGLLTAGFRIWSSFFDTTVTPSANVDFEAANFTIKELIEVVQGMAHEEGLLDFAFHPDEITERLEEKRLKEKDPALGEVLKGLCHNKGFQTFSKNEKWGQKLAEYSLEKHKAHGEIAPPLPLRPIEAALFRVVNIVLGGADFQLALEKGVVNEDGEVIEKQS